MTANAHFLFHRTELDADLLTTPDGLQTRWHVIDGSPSCGKTTLINLLAERGYHIIPECARIYMEGELAKGRTIAEIHDDTSRLERAIFDFQRINESGLDVNETLFLDGALPCSLAWSRAFGMNPNDFLPQCFRHRYASVSILEPLPYHCDGLRFEENIHIRFLDEWLTRDYTDLGYQVVRVPVLPPVERLAFVLAELGQQDLI